MKDVQIYIKPFKYLLEIIYEGGFLELQENITIPLVFQNMDSSDISKQNCTFSKTINIEGTKINNKIFGMIDHIEKLYDAENDLDPLTIYPNRKLNCIVTIDKNVIIEGIFYIKNIKKIYDDNKYKIIYECNIFENKKNVFSELKEKTLNELDFSKTFSYGTLYYNVGDHYLTDDNVVNAIENNDYTDIYNYPIVNFGNNQSLINISKQETNFPFQSLSSGIVYPSVYLKPILIKIFNDFNIYYDSDFIDGITYDGLFNHLVTIYNKNKEISNLKLFGYPSIGFEFNDTIIHNIPLGRNDTIISGITHKFFNVADFLDSEYNSEEVLIRRGGNPRKAGKYKYTLTLDVYEDESYYYYDPEDLHYPSSFTLKKKFGYPSYGRFQKEVAPGVFVEDEYTISTNIFGIDKTQIVSTPQSVSAYTYTTTGYTELTDNEMLYVDCECGGRRRIINGEEIYTPTPLRGYGVYLEIEKIRELSESADEIKINEILPNITCYEFVMNIFKMFNLKIQDIGNILSTTSGKYYIEPYDDFFNKGVVLDWSDKVDYNKNYSFNFLNNFYYFNMEESDDYYSALYKDVNGKIFGSYKIESDGNIINPGKYNIDIINQSYYSQNGLSTTYNISIPYLYQNSDDTIFSERYDIDFMVGIIDRETIPTYFATNSLNFGGYNTTSVKNSYLDTLTWVNSYTELAGTDYSILFYDENRTEDGLYNKFYKNNVYNSSYLTNNSKEVIYYIDLSLNDIITFEFWDTILIQGQHYYIKKIEYDPTSNSSSKVTLIKKVADKEGTLPTDSFILKNDSGDYILTSDTDGKIII